MIKVAVCNVENLELDKAIKNVTQKRREKINRYRFEIDKKLSCAAQLLSNHMLKEEGIENPKYQHDYYKKPYIKNYNMDFNVSHSKEMVACAISDKTVGIDIEYIDKDIDLNIAKHYFYNSEYTNILKSNNKAKEFFKYWVLKESFMKYTSLGFNLNLDEFNININNKEIYVTLTNRKKTLSQIRKNRDRIISLDNLSHKLYELDEYMLAVTSQEKVVNYETIDVRKLY